jgi:hypothetical protein
MSLKHASGENSFGQARVQDYTYLRGPVFSILESLSFFLRWFVFASLLNSIFNTSIYSPKVPSTNPITMHISLVALALVATVAATPFPWAQPQVTSAPVPVVSVRPNATKTRSNHHHHHKEPTPSFKLGCECPQAIIPVDKLSASEVSCRPLYESV